MDYIERSCEEIDAAMFSGDYFCDEKHRVDLMAYMGRWMRELSTLQVKVEDEGNE